MGGARGLPQRAAVFQGRSKVIDGMTLANNGKAINYDGSEIPW